MDTKLTEEQILDLLEGHENIIASEAKKEERYIKATPCPVCNSGEIEVSINYKNPFSPGKILPNKIMRCLECKSELEPETGIVLTGLSTPG